MRTQQQPFVFQYPVTKSEMVNGRKSFVHQGDLLVEGEATKTPLRSGDSVIVAKVTRVFWGNANVLRLIDSLLPSTMADIRNSASEHAMILFDEKELAHA